MHSKREHLVFAALVSPLVERSGNWKYVCSYRLAHALILLHLDEGISINFQGVTIQMNFIENYVPEDLFIMHFSDSTFCFYG